VAFSNDGEKNGRSCWRSDCRLNYDAVLDWLSGAGRAWPPVTSRNNLGPGWVGFDFNGRPSAVKIINDAAMQALGSYRGGRMLFLGLGTGLGSALIVDGVLEPLELAHLPYKHGRTYEDYVGLAGLKRLGKKKWRHHVNEVVHKKALKTALQADYVCAWRRERATAKGASAKTRLGDNANAFRGGFRLWTQSHRDSIRDRFVH